MLSIYAILLKPIMFLPNFIIYFNYMIGIYSGDPNREHLNSGNIWIMNFYLFAIQMPANSSNQSGLTTQIRTCPWATQQGHVKCHVTIQAVPTQEAIALLARHTFSKSDAIQTSGHVKRHTSCYAGNLSNFVRPLQIIYMSITGQFSLVFKWLGLLYFGQHFVFSIPILNI